MPGADSFQADGAFQRFGGFVAAEKLDGETLIGKDGPEGLCLLCASGDGGGLYMMVAGVIGMISGESAQRAALGAGAALILGDRLAREQKKAAGWVLFLVGVATTVPILATVISRRRW